MRGTLSHFGAYRLSAVRGSLVFAALALALAAFPAPSAESAGEVSRRVLAVYNGVTPEGSFEARESRIYEFFETSLNHLGFFVDYVDVNDPLPSFEGYRGIIVWLDYDAMRDPDQLIPWLIRAMDAGVRIILPEGLEEPAGLDGRPPREEGLIGEFQTRFGIAPKGEILGDAGPYEKRSLLPEKFGFETDVSVLPNTLPIHLPTRPGMKPWQIVVDAADPSRYGATVAAGDAGAWAINENFLYFSFDLLSEYEGYRVAWNLDPLAFLSAGLGCDDMPRPDVTTFWGARGAYSHVDVDGPYNRGQDWPGPSRYSVDIIYDMVWSVIPYPVSLAFIACEYNPDIDLRFLQPGDTMAEALARPRAAWQGTHADIAMDMRKSAARAMSLPNTQAACHGFSHPLFWLGKMPAYAIAGYEFSYEAETAGAIDYLNKYVLPPDKPVEVFHWTGDCAPPEEPLAILKRIGVPDINGGDPRYDGKFSSIYYIGALTEPAGRLFQTHSSGTNENVYTVEWTGFKGAYNNVVATFERSDSPRRLLPVNIYYHTFPAERQAGLYAIKHAYDWAAGQDLCWIRTAQYCSAVQSFVTARIGRAGDDGWWAEDYGSCPSLRFDNEARVPDMRASVNIAGWVRHNGSLYVSLIPGPRAEVRFAPEGETPALTAPALARSSGMLRNIRAEERRWTAELCGWGPGFVELWTPAGDWRASAALPDGTGVETTARRLDDGRLRLEFPDAAGKWLEVAFEL